MSREAFEELTDALAEGIAVLSKDGPLIRRRVTISDPPRYSGTRIRALRKKLGASQTLFAEMLGVSPNTLSSWERDLKAPSSIARRMLQVVEDTPEVVRRWASIEPEH